MMTGFPDLPSELIAQIFDYLNKESICNGRITCRILYQATLPVFGRRFLRKKGYLIYKHSLDVLEDIANHPQLRNYVRHVWFNPDLYTFVLPEFVEQSGAGYRPQLFTDSEKTQDQSRLEMYFESTDDYLRLMYSEALTVRLATIFANLPLLEVVGMRRSTGYSACGWKRLEKSIGVDPRVLGPIPYGPLEKLSGTTMLYVAILNAARAAEVRLKRLYTDAVELDNLAPHTMPIESEKFVCQRLQWLEVNLIRGDLLPKPHGNYITLDTSADFGRGLRTLLQACQSSLHGLDLMVFPDRTQRHMLPPRWNQTESWRSSYPYIVLRNVVQDVQLTNLRRLKLEKLASSSSILLNLLKPCRNSLQSLKIRDMRLLTDTESDGGEDQRPWGVVFAFLASSCPNLEFVLFHLLRHASGGVTFEESDPSVVANNTPGPDGAIPVATYGGPAGGEMFTSFDHITLKIKGLQEVRLRLSEAVENHFYGGSVFSYAMDEDLWHTDTSDEEG